MQQIEVRLVAIKSAYFSNTPFNGIIYDMFLDQIFAVKMTRILSSYFDILSMYILCFPACVSVCIQ